VVKVQGDKEAQDANPAARETPATTRATGLKLSRIIEKAVTL